MRFILIRHGQSGNNQLWAQTGGVTGRHPDTELTELGLQQSRQLAAAIGDGVLPWEIDHLHCSLMTRAVQTAVPLADQIDAPLAGHAELFEVRGPYDLDAETGDPVVYPGAGRDALGAHSRRLTLPAEAGLTGWWAGPVETDLEAPDRARRVIAGLRATYAADATVALVTHGFFTQFLLRELLGIETMTGWFDIHNTSLTLLADDPAGSAATSLVRLDWTPHLTPDQITD